MRIIYIIIICLFTVSCSTQDSPTIPPSTQETLTNIFEYFKNDSLKLKSAVFLAKRLHDNSYIDSSQLSVYYRYYELFSTGLTPEKTISETESRYGFFQKYNIDLSNEAETFDSALFVTNIQTAVDNFRKAPWSASISEQIFLEYILPHRLANEHVTFNWRDSVLSKYSHWIDTLNTNDPRIAAQRILDSLVVEPVFFTNSFPIGPHLGYNTVKWRSGGCREYADLVAYVMRAFSIPCTIDYLIMRGDNNAPHFWNSIIGKNGQQSFVEFPGHTLKPLTDFWFPKAKVYRQTYSKNDSISREFTNKYVNQTWKNPRFIDVSKFYNGIFNKKITFPCDKLYEKKTFNSTYCLCVSERQNWIPIAFAKRESGQIVFNDVEGDVVFRIGQFENEKMEMVSDPFLMDKNTGETRFFAPGNDMVQEVYYYKYHLYSETFTFRIPGSTFEGANNEDFSDKDTLAIISEPPQRLINFLYCNNGKKYKYVRFHGVDGSNSCIGEVEFYENTNDSIPLSGDIIGTPGCYQNDGSHEYTNVFDGDPYTSFDYKYPSGGWAGLSLDKKREITKIKFIPRTRDNFIRKGDEYELLFWENKDWKSLGKVVAQSDSIIFEAPKNALLYLKNHTRGKDERIFEYSNGKQKFW